MNFTSTDMWQRLLFSAFVLSVPVVVLSLLWSRPLLEAHEWFEGYARWFLALPLCVLFARWVFFS